MEHRPYQGEVPADVLARENYRASANFRWLGSSLKEAEKLCLTVCGMDLRAD